MVGGWRYARPMSETRKPKASHYAAYIGVLLLGGLSGIAGTLVHRLGATQVFPYGIIIAFLLLISSAYWARSVAGAIGIGLHIIGSSSALWLLMGKGPGGDVLIPVWSPAFTTFVDQHAGIIWLCGSLLVQVCLLILPSRWLGLDK